MTIDIRQLAKDFAGFIAVPMLAWFGSALILLLLWSTISAEAPSPVPAPEVRFTARLPPGECGTYGKVEICHLAVSEFNQPPMMFLVEGIPLEVTP